MKLTVAVIGLGYVGLPLAELLHASKKFAVVGIDISAEAISRARKSGIDAHVSPQAIRKADIVVVCVPTPIKKNHLPDYEPLISAIRTIAQNNKSGQLVIVESTINPGTCEEIVIPIFEKFKKKIGNDYLLAHCPERIDPGNKKWTLMNIPRNVAGFDRQTGIRAKAFYNSFLQSKVTLLNSLKAAEATKIVENTFRDINIAYVNELAISFDKLGIDILEVIKGASSKPFAFMPHYPGCGVGGHCIPVDPYYLIERAKHTGFAHPFLRMARAVNNDMPAYTVSLLDRAAQKMGLKHPQVGILGLAYKEKIDDMRESPAIKIMEILHQRGYRYKTFDPYIPNYSTAPNLITLLKFSDAIILVTQHQQFLKIAPSVFQKNKIQIVIDGRNCLNKIAIQKAGIYYKGIGH